jgi:hypothetical protein
MHSLRQSFASLLATDLELAPTTLAQLIGHADAGFTLRVYARDTRDTAAVCTERDATLTAAPAVPSQVFSQVCVSPAAAPGPSAFQQNRVAKRLGGCCHLLAGRAFAWGTKGRRFESGRPD